jgi:hypothetical protein
MEVFKEVMEILAKDQYQITDYTEHSFSGTFTPSREKELVMTTLAYDKAWKVTVDGKEVKTVKALGSLVAFYVEGDVGQVHNVELVYSPQTIWVGLTISLIAIGFFILLIILRKPMMRVKILRAVVSIPDYRNEETKNAAKALQNPTESAQDAPNAPKETDHTEELSNMETPVADEESLPEESDTEKSPPVITDDNGDFPKNAPEESTDASSSTL